MKCKHCGKDFSESGVTHGKSYDRGDGVIYGSSTYSVNYRCPYCGCNNSPLVFLGC
jgi:hypothetical protein